MNIVIPKSNGGIFGKGECIRVQDVKKVYMKKGDFWHTLGNVSHDVIIEDKGAIIIDIFFPSRKYYLRPWPGLW